ncbi:MAG: transglycosylase [Candidatus Binatia bacterium]|nr:MAG: transglycosylase [Candidatus Binatia bacterium]
MQCDSLQNRIANVEYVFTVLRALVSPGTRDTRKHKAFGRQIFTLMRESGTLWSLSTFAIVAVVLSFPCSASASRGWGYLIERLVRDGEPRAEVERIFSDPRMPPFDGLRFSPEPKPEPRALYRGFLHPRSVAEARKCWEVHRSEIRQAERVSGVPATLLASLFHVESRCGQNTGQHRVLFRLSRLAMAGEPRNFEWNTGLWLDGGRWSAGELLHKLGLRARYLEDTFYPEVRATLELARRWQIDPLELRGSPAGAVGWPQFLPSNVIRFGRDGNQDGRVDLFDPADAALSAAEYLRAYGWQPGASREEQRKVLWHYNRSFAYVDTLLALHRSLQATAPSSARAAVAAPAQPTRAKKTARRPQPLGRKRTSRTR